MKGHGPLTIAARVTIVVCALLTLAIFGADILNAQTRGKKKSGSSNGGSTTTGTTTGTTKVDGKTYTYFPTASTTDGRFLSLTGTGLQSLAGEFIEFRIGMVKGTDSVRIEIFDGETSGLWDMGTTPLVYTLYADPLADGKNETVVATWNGADMKDNDWFKVKAGMHPAAMSADSNYHFRLHVALSDPTQKAWSNFKLRTNGSMMMFPRAFSFAVPLFTAEEAKILYPQYPLMTETTYDGTWTFSMDVPTAVEALEVWDGDMDFGSYDGLAADTDDADTPNDKLPRWATGTPAVKEGVAVGSDFALINGIRSTTTKMTGAPADDNSNVWYRRSPSVEYDVVDPYGTVYTNSNPSGNLEWERFRISTVITTASDYDYVASILPAGVYKVNMRGVDLGNLNAWRMWYNLLGTTEADGQPALIGVDSSGNPVEALKVKQAISIGGTGTIGYWTNHPESWPVSQITLGGVTYTVQQAITYVMGSTGQSAQLARQLLAAKLNVMVGNSASCIYDIIEDADIWLAKYPIGTSKPDWKTGEPLHDALDMYNQGKLDCAKHRDSKKLN